MSSRDPQNSMTTSEWPVPEAPNGSPSQLPSQLFDGLTLTEPFLKIIEQPKSLFRFRYRSESGTHGCILGETSSPTVRTHPTVELVNYNKRAVIRCRLAQHLKDAEHPHRLDLDEDRDFSAMVPEDGSYRVRFPGMGIMHTLRKDVAGRLFRINSRNQLQDFDDNVRMNQAISNSEARSIDLNIVRLMFSAHDPETDHELCEPVFSHRILNTKSPVILKICRTSHTSGLAKGGDEVIILVEPVHKKDIEVRFVERDAEGNERWSALAHFLSSDVHHQCAIVYRTPAYKDQHIASDVKVGVELFRPSDGRCSDPVEFTYRADPAARHAKKRKPNTSPYSSHNSLGTGSIKSQSDMPDPVSNMFINTNMEIDYDISGMPNAMPFVGPQRPQPTPYEVHYSVGLMMPEINSFPEINLTSAEFKKVLATPIERQEFTGYFQEYLRENSDYYGCVPDKLDSYNIPLQ